MASFNVYDDIHCDLCGKFCTFAEALAEIRRRCAIPWDQLPNRAPCKSWKTCGRKYRIREYSSPTSDRLLNSTDICDINADGIKWLFEDATFKPTVEHP
ncbi:MAG TPA: hypothetical protein VMM76_01620 [Pirellulaceae bacterium]|nr:hypothetical protein [Pirellulaceae bacterium]